ncbi:cell cycle exit and neuronal differentiation protein 1-like [Acipenser oxyrinchus oxyrinchus]|uniref:Cell cycle exit and neuronal differentiation protein 1-like n=1 Tax=Acipenser oxyrinchus oxyrinchus TaxID=40147 RepID=A0AAD8G3M3_ACIOX|nr:cell cycle exit and neuronal differentiation protein 1-like [Acipenser oxyrinchus oxyrinchus]
MDSRAKPSNAKTDSKPAAKGPEKTATPSAAKKEEAWPAEPASLPRKQPSQPPAEPKPAPAHTATAPESSDKPEEPDRAGGEGEPAGGSDTFETLKPFLLGGAVMAAVAAVIVGAVLLARKK